MKYERLCSQAEHVLDVAYERLTKIKVQAALGERGVMLAMLAAHARVFNVNEEIRTSDDLCTPIVPMCYGETLRSAVADMTLVQQDNMRQIRAMHQSRDSHLMAINTDQTNGYTTACAAAIRAKDTYLFDVPPIVRSACWCQQTVLRSIDDGEPSLVAYGRPHIVLACSGGLRGEKVVSSIIHELSHSCDRMIYPLVAYDKESDICSELAAYGAEAISQREARPLHSRIRRVLGVVPMESRIEDVRARHNGGYTSPHAFTLSTALRQDITHTFLPYYIE